MGSDSGTARAAQVCSSSQEEHGRDRYSGRPAPGHPAAADGPPARAARRRPGGLRRTGLPRRGDGRHRRPRRGQQAGALPALPGQARALPGAAGRALRGPGRTACARRWPPPRQQAAGRRRTMGRTSTSSTARARRSGWSSSPTCATTPTVRERVDRAHPECAEAIAEVIAEDTGAARDEALLLGIGPGRHGPGQRPLLAAPAKAPSPRSRGDVMPALAWRGISGFPRTGA